MSAQTKKLHRQLMRTHTALGRRLANTADLATADAIMREMEEVNFRVMMAGRLLFRQTTAALNQQISAVLAAAAEVDQAISDLQQAKALVKKISSFLGQVDRILDKIKLLAL